MSEYIIFPSTINERLEKRKISSAAYSDLLRLSLLEHYGGTWLDATVLLTDSIPNYVQESDFFHLETSVDLCIIQHIYAAGFFTVNPIM